MKTILQTVDGWAIPGFAAFWLTAVSVLAAVVTSDAESADAAAPTAEVAPASEMVNVELADVIASQGNEALRQIRAESTRLVQPDLRDVAVTRATPQQQLATR